MSSILDKDHLVVIIPRTLRGRAVAARRAHNPEVIGSNPIPATDKGLQFFGLGSFLLPNESISAREELNS